MTAQNHRQQFPSFHIGDHDRLTIDGRSFRVIHQTNGAFVLCPADAAGLSEPITSETLVYSKGMNQ